MPCCIVTALAYYAAPFELVSRLLILPVALSGALFPALASAHERDLAKGRALRGQSLQLIFAVVFQLRCWVAYLRAHCRRLVRRRRRARQSPHADLA